MNDRFQPIRDALAMGPTPGPRNAVEQSVIGPHDLHILHANVTFSVGKNGSHSVLAEEAIANATLAAAATRTRSASYSGSAMNCWSSSTTTGASPSSSPAATRHPVTTRARG